MQSVFNLSSVFSSLYENIIRKLVFSTIFIILPSLGILQGYVLFNTIRASHLAPFCAFGFLPLAVRSAQPLGLHVDSTDSNLPDREERHDCGGTLSF
jgi:hypothetical protein